MPGATPIRRRPVRAIVLPAITAGGVLALAGYAASAHPRGLPYLFIAGTYAAVTATAVLVTLLVRPELGARFTHTLRLSSAGLTLSSGVLSLALTSAALRLVSGELILATLLGLLLTAASAQVASFSAVST